MSDETSDARVLEEALDDEYRAWATYEQVIRDFGPVLPFTRILASEQRHIDALRSLFERYGLVVPENTWLGNVPRYASLREACEAAAAAEVANGRMYDRLLGATATEEILRVLRNLRDASQQRHLPAFQRCAERAADAAGARHAMGRRHSRRTGRS